MIYFIGGPPRVRKSMIARAIIADHGVNAVSTDSLGVVLQAVLDAAAQPGLFAVTRFNEMAEGVAVLPELVAQLEGVDYRVAFVGNQGRTQRERIKRSAQQNEYDWMRHTSEQYMDAFATCVV